MDIDGETSFRSRPGVLATPQVIEGLNDGKVLASEIGATVTGINADNFRQYLLELAHAVAAGQLQPAKYAVGMKASGIPVGDDTPTLLAETLWVVWVEVQGGEGNAATQALIADLTKELMKEQLVTKDVLMMNMDREFLEEVGAVAKADHLRKKEVQLNTRMHYTQRRFNLLPEESEGFAKLITTLCQSGSRTPVDHLVREVKALIGFFDLDPSRVYDIILEAFESAPKNTALLALMPLFSAEARTQILGFKFQRLAADGIAPPEALFNIAAQLIKASLVPLEGLLPHLSPPDEEALTALQAARKKLAEAVAKIGTVSLTQAAAEKDEAARFKVGLTAAKMELDARVLNAEILAPALAANHKLGLAAGLLQVDDWDNASKLLNLLAGLKLDPVAFPPIASALCGMLRSRLQPAFDALYPEGPRGLCILNRKNGGQDVEIAPPSEDTVGLLLLLGAHAHADPALLSQLARILTHALLRSSHLLSSPPTIAEGRRRIDLVKLLLAEVLLPALCMVPANVGLVNDIWGVLHFLDYTDRWCIYNSLKAKVAGSPLLAAAGKLAVTEVRKVMRRVHAPDSKDKRERKRMLAPFARLLAKAAHANPLPVCDHIVGHVEAYPVMTEPILDAMRFFTPFGYDVLSFVLVDRLGSTGRDKLKADGLNISDWLQGLSGFVGQACRRYERMDTSAICQYLANTLKAAQSFDLLVLKALVSDMTGIAPVSDLSAEQVEALAGGPLLQQEVINLGGAQQASAKALSRTSNRLVAALQNDRLALPLYIMLAQQRRYIATSTDSPHLKLIAELYDKCQETLFLYTEFLSTALPPAERAALLPPISELVQQYGVDFEVAFQAHRPLIKDLSPPPVAALAEGIVQENGDTTMEEVEDGELEEEKLPAPAEATGTLPNGVAGRGAAEPAGPGPGSQSWQALVDDVRGTLPEDVWRVMSPEFYVSFWSLSYADIFVPVDRYNREMARLRDLQGMKEAEGRSKQVLLDQARDPRSAGGGGYMGGMGGGYGRGNEPHIDAEELEDDIIAIQKLLVRVKDALKRLPEELRAQEANAARVDAFLSAARRHWACDRRGMLYAYLQQCILPRVVYSPPDAAFCAKFTQRLHELAVPFFPTILYFDTMMKQMVSLVFCCTDREALNLAIFLNETFILLERWRGSESIYAKECAARPGFSMSFVNPEASRTSFGDYRRLCAKWQHTITSGLRAALQSKNYVQTRNAFLILNTTVKVFPAMSVCASRIKAAVQGVRDAAGSEEDLKTMANMYSVALENEIRKPGRMLSKEAYEGAEPKKLEVPKDGTSARPPTAGKPGASSSRAQEDGSSTVREEAAAGAGKDGKPSAGEAAKAESSSTGQRRKELRPDAPEFRPGSGSKAASNGKAGADVNTGTETKPGADAKSGADAKPRSGAGGKSEGKGRGDGKSGAEAKRPSDSSRRRDGDKAEAAPAAKAEEAPSRRKAEEDDKQRPSKRPRSDAEAAEPQAPAAARQRINPPVREKPATTTSERRPDDPSDRRGDRDVRDSLARRSRSGAVADGKALADGDDSAKRAKRAEPAAPAAEGRRRAIPAPAPRGAAAAAAETPEPGEVVDAAPAARKRGSEKDRDDKPATEPRGRASRETRRAPDHAEAEKQPAAAKSGAEKGPRETAGGSRLARSREEPDKPAAAAAVDKGSGRSSRDGGAAKEKEARAAEPTKKERPEKAEERGPLAGRLSREPSGSEKPSPKPRNMATAWLQKAAQDSERASIASRLGLPLGDARPAAAADAAAVPSSPSARRVTKQVLEAALAEEEDGEEEDGAEEGDRKGEGRKRKKKSKSKEKKRHREKGDNGGEEGAGDDDGGGSVRGKKDKKKHKKAH